MEQVEIIKALETLGLNPKKAEVLTEILTRKQFTQHELERATDLQQPVVSHIISDFTKDNFIAISERIKNNIGRPTNVYRLSKTPEVIAKELRERQYNKKKIDNSVRLISKLNEVTLAVV